MFDFFKKRKERAKARDEKQRTIKDILGRLEKGNGIPLEGALVVHMAEGNQKSLAQLILTLGSADIWILNEGNGRLDGPAVTEGSEGKPYLAAFSSAERAQAAAIEWELPNRPQMGSALEILFPLNEMLGFVINANDEHVRWSFTPEQVAHLRKVFEHSFNLIVGGIYSLWARGAYRAAKILAVDEGGMHIRVYANGWPERPKTIDPVELTLDSGATDGARAYGHLPLLKKSFLAMGPRHAVTTSVDESELEGHRMWAEAKGGYFGA